MDCAFYCFCLSFLFGFVSIKLNFFFGPPLTISLLLCCVKLSLFCLLPCQQLFLIFDHFFNCFGIIFCLLSRNLLLQGLSCRSGAHLGTNILTIVWSFGLNGTCLKLLGILGSNATIVVMIILKLFAVDYRGCYVARFPCQNNCIVLKFLQARLQDGNLLQVLTRWNSRSASH